MTAHAPRNVAVLGATGSIGASALDVIARHPDRYRASVLAAGGNVEALLALCVAHRPAAAVIADEALYARLKDDPVFLAEFDREQFEVPAGVQRQLVVGDGVVTG